MLSIYFSGLIVIVAISIALIFHEIGHYSVGKYYRLEPRFTIKFPHPAVYVAKGNWPNKWVLLSGVVFSFFGYPVFLLFLELLNLSVLSKLYFSLGYFLSCILSLGFYKYSDYYYFRHFDELGKE